MTGRKNPFEDLEQMIERMSSQFEESMGGGMASQLGGGASVDVADRDDEFVVTADLPGFRKEDIDVTLRGDHLQIHAETEAETEEEGDEDGRYIRKERRHQSVNRTNALPSRAQSSSMTLETGADAPTVEATNQRGETIAPDFSAPTVLYFYPRDDTPGCTTEAEQFDAELESYRDAGVSVFGVSTDDVASHEEFAEKYELRFDLLADPEGEVADAFDVDASRGATARTTFVLADGEVKAVYEGVGRRVPVGDNRRVRLSPRLSSDRLVSPRDPNPRLARPLAGVRRLRRRRVRRGVSVGPVAAARPGRARPANRGRRDDARSRVPPPVRRPARFRPLGGRVGSSARWLRRGLRADARGLVRTGVRTRFAVAPRTAPLRADGVPEVTVHPSRRASIRAAVSSVRSRHPAGRSPPRFGGSIGSPSG